MTETYLTGDAGAPDPLHGSMVGGWIAPLDVPAFTRTVLGREAWARPGSAARACELLDWQRLERVLADGSADAIVCADGVRLPWPAPRDWLELRAYFRLGVGLCLRHAERCDVGLACLGNELAEAFERPTQVQLFVTPGGTHGFSWHYDREDVFIVQTAGHKDYMMRENTIERDAAFPPPDFTAFRAETSPLQAATLLAGDFLYIPARWWHMASAREDALSVSIGVG